jgi:1,4-dihydroxy-2-naphthoyl-CoA hydrolase
MTTTTHTDFKSFGDGYLPGLVGVEIITVSREVVHSRMAVRREVMAPNGFLHAASVIALADTSCGYGCVATLPEGAKGFTTIELKSNFLGTARDGYIACRATSGAPPRSGTRWSRMRQAGRRSPSSGAPRWFCGRIRNRDAPVLLRLLLLPAPAGGGNRLSSARESQKNRQRPKPGGFFLPEACPLRLL